MQGVLNRDRISALVLLAFSIAYGVLAYDIELYFVAPDDPFTPRTFPIALSWAGGIVALLILILPGQGRAHLLARRDQGDGLAAHFGPVRAHDRLRPDHQAFSAF